MNTKNVKKLILAMLCLALLAGWGVIEYRRHPRNSGSKPNGTQVGNANEAPETVGSRRVGVRTVGTGNEVLIPYLGAVRCKVADEVVPFARNLNGQKSELALRVLHTEAGILLGADREVPGAKNYEKDFDTWEEMYKRNGLEILGLPKEPPQCSLSGLLHNLDVIGNLQDAKVLRIRYVLYKDWRDPEVRPVFIIHIFGMITPWPDDNPNLEQLKAIRVLANSKGEPYYMDDIL